MDERSNLTLERIDRVFISLEWEDQFPNYDMRGLSIDASDHARISTKLSVAHVVVYRMELA